MLNTLSALERAQRDTITAIERQTEQLLSPDSRLFNLPSDFVVPSYNPAGGVSAGGNVTYGPTNVSMTFEIRQDMPPEKIRQLAEEGVGRALQRRRTRAARAA